MESNITKAIDGITKRLGGDASSENTTEALDTLLSSLSGSVNSTGETLTSDILGKALFERGEVGDIITSTYYDTINNVQYDNPWRIVSAPREVELKSGGKIMATPLQAKYGQLRVMPFSRKRAFIACPDGLEPGTYNVDVNNGNNFVVFTSTIAIPVGGRIAVTPNNMLGSYASDGKTVIETMSFLVTGEKTNIGINLGAQLTFTRNGNISAGDEQVGGSNIWRDSVIRQYLNSDAGVGEWWHPADGWDLAPDELDEIPGYLYELDPEIKSMLKEVKVVTNGNITNGYDPIVTYDKVVLPSLDEMYIESSETEGEAFDYWKELKGTEDKYKLRTRVYSSSGYSYINYYDDFIFGRVVNNAQRISNVWFRSPKIDYAKIPYYAGTADNMGFIQPATNAINTYSYIPVIYI